MLRPRCRQTDPRRQGNYRGSSPTVAGWRPGAQQATAKALREQSIVLKGSRAALLSMNQPDGSIARMRVAGSEARELVRILSKWRQGGDVRTDKPPQGSIGAYYPETNPLLPLAHHDLKSKTPAAKSIPVLVRPQ